jgi:ABC-type Na+ transport system ATPase subunit NatA
MVNAVSLEGVSKTYGDFHAVRDVGFEVPAGRITGFLGPNGAGKTSTIRMILGLLPASAGRITVLGADDATKVRDRIGFLPEERGLYPKMRVLEMLAFMGELRGLTGKDARGRSEAWLERLGLTAWRKNKVQDLSKGMQQKVQFAATMIHEPELVILDEPWSGLDPINADVLRDVVREILDTWSAATGVATRLSVVRGVDADPAVTVQLAAALREMLHNIDKHAEATRVEVELTADAEGLELVVRDDGVGFEPSHARRNEAQGHFGLRGLHERAAQVGGTMTIDSDKGEGTTIRWTARRQPIPA